MQSTSDFYDKYLEYAQNQGYSHNTIESHIKNIKSFMREAFERDLTKNVSFKRKRFKILEEETQSIHLTQEDLSIIANINLTENPKLDKVRDLFIIACIPTSDSLTLNSLML